MKTPVSVPLVRAPRKRGQRDKADACTMVIFGGVGDLTKRKLIPAIYYLAEQKLLPDNFALLGVARDQNTDEGYRKMMREAMANSDEIHKVHEDVWEWLCQRTFYAGGDFSKDDAYANIEKRLREIEAPSPEHDRNRLFYLAIHFCLRVVPLQKVQVRWIRSFCVSCFQLLRSPEIQLIIGLELISVRKLLPKKIRDSSKKSI